MKQLVPKFSSSQPLNTGIMTNPNCVLGKWLLRDVLNLKEGTLITYDILQKKGIDTVIFTKYDEEHYAIDFTDSDTYYQKYDEE